MRTEDGGGADAPWAIEVTIAHDLDELRYGPPSLGSGATISCRPPQYRGCPDPSAWKPARELGCRIARGRLAAEVLQRPSPRPFGSSWNPRQPSRSRAPPPRVPRRHSIESELGSGRAANVWMLVSEVAVHAAASTTTNCAGTSRRIASTAPRRGSASSSSNVLRSGSAASRAFGPTTFRGRVRAPQPKATTNPSETRSTRGFAGPMDSAGLCFRQDSEPERGRRPSFRRRGREEVQELEAGVDVISDKTGLITGWARDELLGASLVSSCSRGRRPR